MLLGWDETSDGAFQTVLLLSVNVVHLSNFISNRRHDDFKARTQVNCLSALIRHLTFLRYLTYPDLATAAWPNDKLLLRRAFCPSVRSEAKIITKRIKASHTYARQQINRDTDRAEQQVKARNSREALQEQGTWFTIDWIRGVARALDEEGWARMRRLQAVLRSTSLHTLVGVCTFC